MKRLLLTILATGSCLLDPARLAAAQPQPPSVYQSPRELFSTGDFDGDGRTDAVIVDRDSGKVRLGYQATPGMLRWVDNRPSGVKGVGGLSVAKMTGKNDELVFSSTDANQLTVVDVSSPTSAARPVVVPFEDALGPTVVVAIDIGGAGNTPAPDLYVGSIYNSPEANQASLLRNGAGGYSKLLDAPLAGVPASGARVTVKPGQPDLLALILSGEQNDTLQLLDLASGKPVVAAETTGLPKGSDFAVGDFTGTGLDLLVYQPGANQLQVLTAKETGGKYALSKGASLDLGKPIRRVVTVPQAGGLRLFLVFGEGEKAGLFKFDGTQAPVALQELSSTNDLFTAAVGLADGFVAFSQPATGKFSTRYQLFKAAGDAYTATAFGGLPTLADNDNITIPDIHRRIEANTKVRAEDAMQAYTNTIPGTRVNYAMIPIKGGEYTMGSPDSEPNRKPDEGPQHRVKISPFWMGRCEVTWNEYELFMYPDEERRMRANLPTDKDGDKLADAVTHPSKPYVEMSFGMGKDGFPAISMTQHAANKYCQWLSAKTGEFYRLPTEAEWEYACRAGTTTTYFFGEDASKLPEYGWYEMNSDFKYQKVGKKKPNPWGLYDMYGNVVEWVLDQYDPEFYKVCQAKGVVVDPWNKATKPYPHGARGGSWDDQESMLRSAVRRGSDRSWKMQDPQLPKSIWYFSDAQFVGFRIVRPLKVPSPEEMQKYWSSGVERD